MPRKPRCVFGALQIGVVCHDLGLGFRVIGGLRLVVLGLAMFRALVCGVCIPPTQVWNVEVAGLTEVWLLACFDS